MRRLLCSLMCFVLAFSFGGCSRSTTSGGGVEVATNEVVTNGVTTIDDNAYYADYNEVYDLIKAYNSGLSMCAKINLTIIQQTFDFYSGNNAGASKIWGMANQMILLSKAVDDQASYESYLTRNGVTSTSNKNQVSNLLRYIYYDDNYYNKSLDPLFATFKACNIVRKALPDRATEIKTAIEDLRSKYGTKYSMEIELLDDWFSECKSYSTEMERTSGESLYSFTSKMNQFETELNKLASKADRH